MITRELSATPQNFYRDLLNIIRSNKPGERIRINVPHEISHLSDNKSLDWEEIEEIEQYIRGGLPSDQFLTLRFEKDNVVVDVYHL